MDGRQLLDDEVRLKWRRTAAAGWLLALLATQLIAARPAAAALARPQATFVHVDQNDDETDSADDYLRRELERKLGLQLSSRQLDYGRAIEELSEWKSDQQGPYVAHVTPYVFLAAEMLGADFAVLGTYVSRATRGTTYRSYFVVNREAIGGQAPDLHDLLAFLRQRSDDGEPARFVYHDRFSTSSYFLPALYLRNNGVFSMPKKRGSLIAIQSDELPRGTGSSVLVKKVAAGEADFAAVWDGTKFKFAGQPEAERVFFIPLATALPNDLLVCSRSLLESGEGPRQKDPRGIFRADDGTPAAIEVGKGGIGDFQQWTELESAAHDALVGLRVLAAEQRNPMTVRIDDSPGIPPTYVKAARLALRISGTELVPYEHGFHEAAEDYVWTLRRVRPGYVTLTSKLQAFDVQQTFPISFQPTDDEAEQRDLTQRISGILTSRLHRIRYVWPYYAQSPLIIRDVPFSVDAGTHVVVQKITWTNPQRNGYSESGSRRVLVEQADLFKFRLQKMAFLQAMGDERGAVSLDPMSPVSYRALLLRDEEPQAMFKVFNVAFLLLLGLAVVGTVLAVWRARRLAAPSAPAAVASPLAAPGPAPAHG